MHFRGCVFSTIAVLLVAGVSGLPAPQLGTLDGVVNDGLGHGNEDTNGTVADTTTGFNTATTSTEQQLVTTTTPVVTSQIFQTTTQNVHNNAGLKTPDTTSSSTPIQEQTSQSTFV